MKNLAPAIFPPKGIGDIKPSNKAVLDWVHDIATLTQPENIFWCDGSERENEFLIAESLNQNVLIELNQKNFRARICTGRIRTTSRVSSNSLLSAHQQNREPGRRIIGRSHERPTRNFEGCLVARCAGARCSSFPTCWARRIRL